MGRTSIPGLFACALGLVLTACGGSTESAPIASAPAPAPTPAPAPAPGGADWSSRISGSGVVWYHNFDTAAEVNQFRWTGGYNGGNDPLSKGSGSQFVTWQSSGGVGDGGFLRLTYPLGSVAGRGNSYWWRPFNPLTGTTNGRGTNDPGANGALAPAAFNASDGSNTTNMWGLVSNPGWYANAAEQVANPTKYQGTDFYVQIRTRRAQTPGRLRILPRMRISPESWCGSPTPTPPTRRRNW